MLEDPTRWRHLVAEYGALCRLASGISPGARGQRFNGLIAELLSAFGIPATANVASMGELDVTFRYKDQPYILEAKWEQRKADTGYIAKMQRRVDQRMHGVTGIMLSVGGYSPDALREVNHGRRLDTLLLDKDHWEAMLTGLVPPAELLDLVRDAASFHGRSYTSLSDLLTRKMPVPLVTSVLSPIPGTTASVGSQRTLVVADGRDQVLLAVADGVLGLDTAKHKPRWEVPVPGCTSVMRDWDRSLLVARAQGVGRYHNGRIAAVAAGSSSGTGQVLDDVAGSAWCLDPGVAGHSPAALVRLSGQVGDESCHDLPCSPGQLTCAAWLAQDVVAAGGTSDVEIIHLPSKRVMNQIRLPYGYLVSLTRDDQDQLVAATSDGSTFLLDPNSGHVAELLETRATGESSIEPNVNDMGDVLTARRRQGDARTAHFNLLRARAPVSATDPGSTLEDDADTSPTVPLPRIVRTEVGPPTPPPMIRTVASVAEAAPITQTNYDVRDADRRRGHLEGLRTSGTLPIHAFYELLLVQFDVGRWLVPWRERWSTTLSTSTQPGVLLPAWLLALAPLLGSCVAPPGRTEADFTPPPAYVSGFGEGLRHAWDGAARRRLVPINPTELHDWMGQRVRQPTGPLRYFATLLEIEGAVHAARNRLIWMWAGRFFLWLAIFVFAVCTAIFIAIMSGVDRDPVQAPIVGLLCYAIPFVGLTTFAIFDVRRLWRGRRREASERAVAPEGHPDS